MLRIKQLVQLAPTATGASEVGRGALTELESIDVRACCNFSTLHCQFEILKQFKFQFPLARFSNFCSVWGANSEQSHMSPMCDQGISNGCRFAVYSAQSYSPYYSVRNFPIGFSLPDACNIFLATIGNAEMQHDSSYYQKCTGPRCNLTRYSRPSSRHVPVQLPSSHKGFIDYFIIQEQPCHLHRGSNQ